MKYSPKSSIKARTKPVFWELVTSRTENTLTMPACLLPTPTPYLCNWFKILGGKRQHLGCKSKITWKTHETNFLEIQMWAPFGSTLGRMAVSSGEGRRGDTPMLASVCGHSWKARGRIWVPCHCPFAQTQADLQQKRLQLKFQRLLPWSLSLFLLPLDTVSISTPDTKNIVKG